MKAKDVKITKSIRKNQLTFSSTANVKIEVGGKILDMSINPDMDYVLIHHTTTFTDVTFSSVCNDVKVKTLNQDGSVYSVGLNAKI